MDNRVMTNNNTKKPRIHHLHKGYTEDGKWTPQHRQAVRAADRILNSKGPLPEKHNIKRPTRKRKRHQNMQSVSYKHTYFYA